MDKVGNQHQITAYIWFGLTPYAQILLRRTSDTLVTSDSEKTIMQ